MPELHRTASAGDLQFARRPLDQIDTQRVAAYKARYRNIEKVFDEQIKATFLRTRTDRDRHSTAQSRALESEKERKLEQLREEFLGMFTPTMLEAAKAAWQQFSSSSPYKAVTITKELGGYAQTGLTLAGGGISMGLQVAGTGLLLSNPFTAALALANELDKWIGRAIGWVQMAKKQWDADCSRVSARIAKAIAKAKGDSKLEGARAGAANSTLTRQRLEKLLYHKVWEIREDTIKYKIRECEVTGEAQKLLEQKKGIEAQVNALEKQVQTIDRDLSGLRSDAFVMVGNKKVNARQQQAELKARAGKLRQQCMDLSEKIMSLLNEVVDNCSRLVNQAQADVERMVQEIVRSFQVTEAKGKFTNAHDNGAWLQAIRRAF